MKILFDAFELSPNAGKSIGIYNYAICLLRALSKLNLEGVDIHIACNKSAYRDIYFKHAKMHYHILHEGIPSKFNRQLWLRFKASLFSKKMDADVYYSPKGFLPSLLKFFSPSIRSVVVIHDLIPFWYKKNYPGYFGRLEEFVVCRGLIQTIKNADHIIAISNATSNDIEITTSRKVNSVIYNGIPLVNAGKTNLLGKPYIFAMTSKLPHKNAASLIEAYKVYRENAANPLPLVVCGIDSKVEGVISVKNITNEELHTWYAHANFFIFLSLIEGFGFPPLEAMLHGTAVVCSDIPSLTEVTLGNAAYYVNPNDIKEISTVIELLANQSLINKDYADVLLDKFNWDICARRTLDALKLTLN